MFFYFELNAKNINKLALAGVFSIYFFYSKFLFKLANKTIYKENHEE